MHVSFIVEYGRRAKMIRDLYSWQVHFSPHTDIREDPGARQQVEAGIEQEGGGRRTKEGKTEEGGGGVRSHEGEEWGEDSGGTNWSSLEGVNIE